ncbi:unnamed protein product [marine sediment metagenome]|uniref:Uncharacterized protein n=1 Tax=marine sediment metagenome TaxID=412755 RepID=X1CY78_9ZZZZ
MQILEEKPRLRRDCRSCGQMFTPTGKHCKFCPKCKEKRLEAGKQKSRAKIKEMFGR